MKQYLKRGLSLFLAMLMCLTMLPTSVFAAELKMIDTTEQVDSSNGPTVEDDLNAAPADTSNNDADPMEQDQPGDVSDETDALVLWTYVFTANGSEVSRQVLANGDTVQVPAAPPVEGKAFVGWQRPGEPTALPVDTTSWTVEMPEDAVAQEVTVVAVYRNVCYVTFADGERVYYPGGYQRARL